MNLKILEEEIILPENISVLNLREFISVHLKQYGEPLRWAITNVEEVKTFRKLRVEAIIIN